MNDPLHLLPPCRHMDSSPCFKRSMLSRESFDRHSRCSSFRKSHHNWRSLVLQTIQSLAIKTVVFGISVFPSKLYREPHQPHRQLLHFCSCLCSYSQMCLIPFQIKVPRLYVFTVGSLGEMQTPLYEFI